MGHPILVQQLSESLRRPGERESLAGDPGRGSEKGRRRGFVKTLANGKDRAEIVRRLGAIGPASERRWGKMTAGR